MSLPRSVIGLKSLSRPLVSGTQCPTTLRQCLSIIRANGNASINPYTHNPPSPLHNTLIRNFHQTSRISEAHENKPSETTTPSENDAPQKPPTEPNPICDICRVAPTTKHTSIESAEDKCLWNLKWDSFCDRCYKMYAASRASRRREIHDELRDRKMRRQKMLEDVQKVEGRTRVTIRYANRRLHDEARSVVFFGKSVRQFQRNITDHLRDELGIERNGKRRGDWTCWKERVDAMDWRLWCLYPYLDIKV